MRCCSKQDVQACSCLNACHVCMISSSNQLKMQQSIALQLCHSCLRNIIITS